VNPLLYWVGQMHVLRAQQLVEPLCNHKRGSSVMRLSEVLLLRLPLLVLTRVLTWVPNLMVWALVVLTLLSLPLLSLNLWANLTLNLLILRLDLELILVLVLPVLRETHITVLCHHGSDIRRKILEISAYANVQQFFVECTAWFESCLYHFAQPAPHG